MADLSKDPRVKRELRVPDERVPLTDGERFRNKLKIYTTRIVAVLVSIYSVPEALENNWPTLLFALAIIWGITYWFLHKKKAKWFEDSKLTYKTIPNPSYDPAFARRINTRIQHPYGIHMLYKYTDGTYSVDDRDEFYTLLNFSFEGSKVVTNKKTAHRLKDRGGTLGTVAGALLGGLSGAALGSVLSRTVSGTSETETVRHETPGASTVTFLTADEDGLKTYSAKLTQTEANDLERFFYR